MIRNKSESQMITNWSSNINEVIKTVLNFLLFFYEIILQLQKSTKPLTANKNKKNAYKKTSKRKNVIYSLIWYLCFCLVVFLCF